MKVASYSVGEYVRVIDDLFKPRDIDKFVNVCETIDYEVSKVGGSEGRVDKKVRDASIFNFNRYHKRLTLVHWNNFFLNKINGAVATFFLPLVKYCFVKKAEWFQLLRYKPGGFYDPHVDHAHSTPRSISVIVFLNDNYEGGSLEFLSPDGEHSQKIAPKKGRMVIWPSNFLYPHKANPITKGTRYAIVCWIQ